MYQSLRQHRYLVTKREMQWIIYVISFFLDGYPLGNFLFIYSFVHCRTHCIQLIPSLLNNFFHFFLYATNIWLVMCFFFYLKSYVSISKTSNKLNFGFIYLLYKSKNLQEKKKRKLKSNWEKVYRRIERRIRRKIGTVLWGKHAKNFNRC